MNRKAAFDHLLEGGVLIYIDLRANPGRIRLEPMFFHGDPSNKESQASLRVSPEQLATA